jgi:hypothetical protein
LHRLSGERKAIRNPFEGAEHVQWKTKAIVLAMLSLGACKSGMDFDETGGVKIARSSCPAAAVPTYTGDITLFNSPTDRSTAALDVSATITNVRTVCADAGDRIQVTVSFDVLANRNAAGAARQVSLPWFATVLRAGTQIESKQTGAAVLNFADNDQRASIHASATASVSRAAATLPPEVMARITRKRKVGDSDAAVDPLTDPQIRDAVAKANFEMLVGFQLSEAQLAYNATR